VAVEANGTGSHLRVVALLGLEHCSYYSADIYPFKNPLNKHNKRFTSSRGKSLLVKDEESLKPEAGVPEPGQRGRAQDPMA
jgi:hypothetical protein